MLTFEWISCTQRPKFKKQTEKKLTKPSASVLYCSVAITQTFPSALMQENYNEIDYFNS